MVDIGRGAPAPRPRMIVEEAPLALLADGLTFRLPPQARRLAEPPRPRPLPCAPPGMLGLAMIDRRGVPVWAFSPQPLVWIAAELAGVAFVCGGDKVVALTAEAVPLQLPDLVAQPRPMPIAIPQRWSRPAMAATPARSFGARSDYVLSHGRGAVTVSFATLDGIGTLAEPPEQGSSRLPDGALGMVAVGGRVALLLDPAWCMGDGAVMLAPAPLVALLRIDGRLLAMPIGQAAPGAPGASLEERLLGTPEGRELLAAAPPARAPQAPPPGQAMASLLICEAGGMRFAIATAEVSTILAPLRPAPTPTAPTLRGVVSHRGEILPVMDLAARLSAPLSAHALGSAPLLRLPLPRPVAVPVERVLGLRAVPLAAIEPVAEDALVSGMAALEGASVPVCRAAALPAGRA